LEKHLSILKREKLIKEWYDGKIIPGRLQDREIGQNLARAEIVLLLISSDFIGSDYCWGNEMNQALKKHRRGAVRVIPIILRPVEDGWKGTVFGRLRALPRDGKPVTTWSNRDRAWADVVNGIRAAIGDLRGRSPKVARKGSRRPKG